MAPWRRVGLLALLVVLIVPAVASAVGISLNRSPAPPQAVQRGGGVQNLDFSITYQTIANNWFLRVTDPSGNIVQSENGAVTGQPSPINVQRTYPPVAGAAVGRYTAQVEFFSSPGSLEAEARVVFDVADQLGTLSLVKFEDVNGNGIREAGEPGVPNWVFNLRNPQGNPSVARTGVDGTVTIAGVPAGTWQVAEVVDVGWVAITPAAGSVTVPAGGVGTFTAGNVRPAPISGVVYLDTNRNGIRDAGEPTRAGVRLDLVGTRPGGIVVTPRNGLSGADGSYSFDGLLPGSYSVSVAVPGGLVATSSRTIPGIAITSGTGSPNNNFGLAGPGGVVTGGGPTPDIGIDKSAPPEARRGSQFTYTVVIRNRSAFPATNVEVTDLVPANLSLVSIPSGATIRNGVVTWDVGTLRPGQSRTLRMRVRVNPNATGTIRNTATVTADNLGPRRDDATTRVTGPVPAIVTGGVTG